MKTQDRVAQETTRRIAQAKKGEELTITFRILWAVSIFVGVIILGVLLGIIVDLGRTGLEALMKLFGA